MVKNLNFDMEGTTASLSVLYFLNSHAELSNWPSVSSKSVSRLSNNHRPKISDELASVLNM